MGVPTRPPQAGLAIPPDELLSPTPVRGFFFAWRSSQTADRRLNPARARLRSRDDADHRPQVTMNQDAFREHQLINSLQSILLLLGMGAVLAAVGWLLGGPELMLWAAGLGLLLLGLSPRVSPQLMLRMQGAVKLAPREAPGLHALVRELAGTAGLDRMPQIYYLRSPVPNAFTLGTRADASIALSDGLLRRLEPRELRAVLAHEISHVRNNDIRIMALADMVARLTGALALLGQLLVLVNLPLLLLGEAQISWLAILLLIFAPVLAALMQLALSRTREFEADLGAAALTGDPHGLASALAKLERDPRGRLGRILLPRRGRTEPSMLRTHPATEARIRRLLALTPGTGPALGATPSPLWLPPASARRRWF